MVIKKRKHIRRISTKRAALLLEYTKARKWFVSLHPWCEWGLLQVPRQWLRATQVHHTRGRAGKLLLAEKFWLAVSAEGHRWIHDHPEDARKLGLMCARGEWGRQP